MTEKIITQIEKNKLFNIFEKDYFAQLIGLKIIDIERGYAKIRFKVTKQLLNGLGQTHGGALFTAADFALAVAANSYGEAAVSTNVSIDYIRATKEGDILEVVAVEESKTRKTGLYSIAIKDETGQKIAIAHGSVYHLGKSLF